MANELRDVKAQLELSLVETVARIEQAESQSGAGHVVRHVAASGQLVVGYVRQVAGRVRRYPP